MPRREKKRKKTWVWNPRGLRLSTADYSFGLSLSALELFSLGDRRLVDRS